MLQTLGEHCPGCEAQGFAACGSNEIGYGQRFAANLFTGSPRRGYLVTFAMTGRELAELIRREEDHARLTALLAERFAKVRLVAIDEDYARVRILDVGAVRAEVPRALHQCFRSQATADAARGECTSDECCDKTHGSSRVEITWNDTEGGETIRYRFGRTVGESRLLRIAGSRTSLHFCMNDSRGRLQ
ncbi:MAG: hypothetical protein KIT81_17995 [Alphaproteobacteria bacterium]|nr:hypothetical protein [Alphaproteobacteria bacterium]